MPVALVNRVSPTLGPNDHPYRTGAWAPMYDEYDATDLPAVGAIPKDIDGVYVRNTENPVHDSIGRYHPFDGDGQIHVVAFRGGRADYRNRFVRTKGFLAEAEAGGPIWAGLAGDPAHSKRPGWGAHGALKDSSSTDVIIHAGQILSTFYQCGEGYRIDPYTMEQFGVERWSPLDGVSAHPKVDEKTGELLFFNYSKHAPYMHYGVVGADNRLKHYTPVPLPGPRLPHDMAFTENYAILNDFPLFWDEELLKRNMHVVRFRRDLPSRFAILPRLGGASDIRWFEAAPTYVLHFTNAYEDGDEIVLDGYFEENPEPKSEASAPSGLDRILAYLDQHKIRPRLHRWRFNLKTGATREQPLDDRVLEFGIINNQVAGRRYRYVYSCVPKPGWFLFTGLVKHDLETGASETLDFGPERYGSEPAFAPRLGAVAEDDGYLVTLVTDMVTQSSECVVYDARALGAGPVCRIPLPAKISSGTHATWGQGEAIRAAQARFR